MRVFITVMISAIITSVQAQEFSSYLTFYTSAGSNLHTSHSDTVTFGYDVLATDSIDALFNENNIFGNPFDSALNVRIGNIWLKQNSPSYSNQTRFQTKKQIIPKHCGNNTIGLIELDIVSENWPIYVRWGDKFIYRDSCRDGTSLTNMNPFEWWHGQGFIEVLAKWDYHPIYPNQWYYMDGSDTVNVFWLAVGDSQSVRLFIPEVAPAVDRFRIRPNPASDYFFADVPDDFGELKSLDIYSPDGRLLYQNHSAKADISFLAKGVYLVTLYSEKQKTLRTRLVKAN